MAACYVQFVLDVCFRPRVEKQGDAAVAALNRSFETRGEVALNYVLITADHGYGRPLLMNEVWKLCLSFIFVIQKYTVR